MKTNILTNYLSDAQCTACLLNAVFQGLNALNHEGVEKGAFSVLAEIAEEIAELFE